MTYLMLALLLAVAGVVLLLAEYFFPTGGFLIIGGILCFIGGVVIVGVNGSVEELVAAIIATCLGVPVLSIGGVYAWKKVFNQNVSKDAESTIADMPEITRLESLRGRFGKTISPMRPSGVVDFEGTKVDALTEGGMLDSNVWVKCIEVKTGRVIVRQIEDPTQNPIAEPEPIPEPEATPQTSPAKKRSLEDMDFA